MIYYLIDLAWALAVRRDTQGNQWNVQTCPTVCNERVRRTDAMMRCHRRYAIAMAHLFSVICNKSGAWSSGWHVVTHKKSRWHVVTHRNLDDTYAQPLTQPDAITECNDRMPQQIKTCARTCRRQYHHSNDDSKKNVCAGTCPRQYRPKQGLQHSLTYTTSLPWPETHHLSQIRISTKKQQKAALHQNNECDVDTHRLSQTTKSNIAQFATSNLRKVLRGLQLIFCTSTSTCAFDFLHFHFDMCFSPQRRAMFRNPTFKMWFDIRTSKSDPKTTVFQHFHAQMCFSPQRRTSIRHRNVQKCSEDYSFLTFSLPNVPFATGACIFST